MNCCGGPLWTAWTEILAKLHERSERPLQSCSISPGGHVNQLRMNFTIASGLHGDCGLCRDFDRKGVGGMERVSAVIDCWIAFRDDECAVELVGWSWNQRNRDGCLFKLGIGPKLQLWCRIVE